MIIALDSSVLIASLAEKESHHAACEDLLFDHDCRIFVHALAETFNTLTGSRLGYRFSASDARGVRGGAIYDHLHLVAARKAGAERFYTLNTKDFIALHRPGDPEIWHPATEHALSARS